MTKHRTLSEKNKYFIPKETFLMVIHYCKQYPMWEQELGTTLDQSKAIRYDRDRVQTSGDYDPTAEPAIKRAEIARKKKTVDEVAQSVAGSMYKWLLRSCTYATGRNANTAYRSVIIQQTRHTHYTNITIALNPGRVGCFGSCGKNGTPGA